MRAGQFGAHRVGLRLRLREVGQEDVGLRLHFSQRSRQPLAALAFTSQLLVRGLERALRLGAGLLGCGLDRRQTFLQRRSIGSRGVKLARQSRGIGDRRVELLEPATDAEATVRGTATDLLLLSSRLEDADTLFFHRRLQLTGDVELGLALRNLLDQLPWESIPLALRIALNRGAQFARYARAVYRGAED